MNEDLKDRIDRAVGLEQAETGETTNFAQWMRDAAKLKLAQQNESSGSRPEETGASA
jgi:hypothetical protein